MTGADLIKWIKDNHAESLPVMIRHVGAKQAEEVEKDDMEIQVRIVGGEQLEYKKYFLI